MFSIVLCRLRLHISSEIRNRHKHMIYVFNVRLHLKNVYRRNFSQLFLNMSSLCPILAGICNAAWCPHGGNANLRQKHIHKTTESKNNR